VLAKVQVCERRAESNSGARRLAHQFRLHFVSDCSAKEKPMSQLYSHLKQPAPLWQLALIVALAFVTMGYMLRPLVS
jgi:hypothetical protein